MLGIAFAPEKESTKWLRRFALIAITAEAMSFLVHAFWKFWVREDGAKNVASKQQKMAKYVFRGSHTENIQKGSCCCSYG